jgi:hypothetical protein
MSKEKKKKRLVSIFVQTAINVPECEDVIKKCIKELDLSRFEIVYSVEGSSVRVFGGAFATHVLICGDSTGGWEHSGMKSLCECFESRGFFVQASNCPHSYIPTKL